MKLIFKSNAKGYNEWSFTSTDPYAFISCAGATLHFTASANVWIFRLAVATLRQTADVAVSGDDVFRTTA